MSLIHSSYFEFIGTFYKSHSNSSSISSMMQHLLLIVAQCEYIPFVFYLMRAALKALRQPTHAGISASDQLVVLSSCRSLHASLCSSCANLSWPTHQRVSLNVNPLISLWPSLLLELQIMCTLKQSFMLAVYSHPIFIVL